MGQAISGTTAGAAIIVYEGVANSVVGRIIHGHWAHKPIYAELDPVCKANGGPFVHMDDKSITILWVLLQAGVMPLAALVILIGLAPGKTCCMRGDSVKATRTRAIVATVLFVLALTMVVFQDMVIDAYRYCAYHPGSYVYPY